MTAKIGLEDVRFHAPHGFYEEEHLMGNEFSIDVEVEANISGAAENDDLGGTVNYATIYYLLQAEMKRPTQLLEALAYRMGNRIMNQFDSVISVTLKLRKLNPPLGGKVGAAVVEIQVGSGGGGGYAGGLRQQQTYEDEPGGGSAFGGSSYGGGGMGGGGMDGLTIKKPPTPAPPPMPVFDESAFEEDEEYYDEDEFDEDDFEEGDFEDGDFEEFDEEDFEEMSEEELLEYEDEEDDGDFDGLDFEALMKKMGEQGFNPDDLK